MNEIDQSGERNIINMIRKVGNIKQKPDDCSLVDRGDSYELITMDSINEKTHIPVGATASEAGRFFAMVNLSDIAAMGGIPQTFMAAFNIRGDLHEEYVEEFVNGMSKTLKEYDLEYAGGDTKESDTNVFSGMCMGYQKKKLTRLRSEIKPHQILCSTGTLGKTGAAYVAYSHGMDTRENSRRMLDIKARISEGMAIGSSGAKFMMDISDGLYGCLSQMKMDYGIGFRISEMDVKLDESVKEVANVVGCSPRDIAFNYGGDYELLFTIDNDDYGKFSKKMEDEGIAVSYIGDTWEGDNMIFNGEQWEKIEHRGWEHLKKGIMQQ